MTHAGATGCDCVNVSVRPVRGGPVVIGAIAAMSLLPALLGGCGKKNFLNENDRLRRAALKQDAEITVLRAQVGELESKLIELGEQSSDRLDPEILEALPRVAGVRIGRLSGLRDADSIPGWDVLDVYISPYDGRNRFVQVTGRLIVEARLLPGLEEAVQADPGGPGGQILGRVGLSPTEVREAYRADLIGQRYSVQVSLPTPNEPLSGDVLVRVEFLDGLTGVWRRAERVIPLRNRPGRMAAEPR